MDSVDYRKRSSILINKRDQEVQHSTNTLFIIILDYDRIILLLYYSISYMALGLERKILYSFMQKAVDCYSSYGMDKAWYRKCGHWTSTFHNALNLEKYPHNALDYEYSIVSFLLQLTMSSILPNAWTRVRNLPNPIDLEESTLPNAIDYE